MPQIIKKGKELEVVFICQKCRTEFICDTMECEHKVNEKNPNKPFYLYTCPNCKGECSTVNAREKGMSNIIERNTTAIQQNMEARKARELEKMMDDANGGYI